MRGGGARPCGPARCAASTSSCRSRSGPAPGSVAHGGGEGGPEHEVGAATEATAAATRADGGQGGVVAAGGRGRAGREGGGMGYGGGARGGNGGGAQGAGAGRGGRGDRGQGAGSVSAGVHRPPVASPWLTRPRVGTRGGVAPSTARPAPGASPSWGGSRRRRGLDHGGLADSDGGENSQSNVPEHTIISSILTDLIFKRNLRRRTALSRPPLNLRSSRTRAMRFKILNRHNTIVNFNMIFQS